MSRGRPRSAELQHLSANLSLGLDELKTLFVNNNPALAPEDLAAIVDRNGNFSEVRVCLSKQLDFIICPSASGGSSGVFLPNDRALVDTPDLGTD